jgi:hypothetical protein
MNFENFTRPESACKAKKSGKIAVIPTALKATEGRADFSERMRCSIALQREYNATLRELIELQTQLMALESLKRRAVKSNSGLFRVPDAS